MRIALAMLFIAGCAQAPIALRDMGSFHVGGRDVEISGKPVKEVVFTPGGVPAKVDPNGTYSVETMYVQYFLPAERRGVVPLLLWHGGGLTGVTYETTPDGREGWLTYFVRQGWDVYNSDAVERGRAGWAMYPDIFRSEPVFLTKANPFKRFRIGQGAGSYSPDPAKQRVLPGSQFPVAAYDNFVKQNVPRWTTTDDAILRAYIAEIDKVCPCALLGARAGKHRQLLKPPEKNCCLTTSSFPSCTGTSWLAQAVENEELLAVLTELGRFRLQALVRSPAAFVAEG